MSTATLEPGILEEIDLIKEKTTGWPQQAKLLLIHTLTETPESATAFGATDEELADDEEFEITRLHPHRGHRAHAPQAKLLDGQDSIGIKSTNINLTRFYPLRSAYLSLFFRSL